MASSNILLEDIFHVKNIDEDGKKWVRVSRLVCESENYEMEMHIDVNTLLYPVELGNKYTITLASSLSLSAGAAEQVGYVPKRKGAEPTLDNSYEYVMVGKVYKVDDERDRMNVYASYGGLLMLLRGDKSNLQGIEKDKKIYLLMRKVETMEY